MNNAAKNALKKFPFVIMCFPDKYKNQEMCDKVILVNGGMLEFIIDIYKIKLLIIILIDYNLFLIVIRLNKSVIKLLILLYLILFLTGIKLKKYSIKLFPKKFLCKNITSTINKTQGMCE